jgi:hypothetical protein
MAPKAKKSDGGSRSKAQEEEREEPLQAVVCKPPSPVPRIVYAKKT